MTRFRLDREHLVYLFDRQQRSPMSFVPWLRTRRATRGTSLRASAPDRRRGVGFLRGLRGRLLASPLLPLLQLRQPQFELLQALPQLDHQHLQGWRIVPIRIGYGKVRRLFHEIAQVHATGLRLAFPNIQTISHLR